MEPMIMLKMATTKALTSTRASNRLAAATQRLMLTMVKVKSARMMVLSRSLMLPNRSCKTYESLATSSAATTSKRRSDHN